MKNNISLIGMPCSGKTTIGRLLSKKLQGDFFDLDNMVEEKEGRTLIDILNNEGGVIF